MGLIVVSLALPAFGQEQLNRMVLPIPGTGVLALHRTGCPQGLSRRRGLR